MNIPITSGVGGDDTFYFPTKFLSERCIRRNLSLEKDEKF